MRYRVRASASFMDDLLEDEATKVATDIYADLLRATPVDTGAARNGWQLDIASQQKTVSNTVPYIKKIIEDGHSQQAPTGTLTNIIDRHTS